jgi:hypothetical protein
MDAEDKLLHCHHILHSNMIFHLKRDHHHQQHKCCSFFGQSEADLETLILIYERVHFSLTSAQYQS